MKLQQLADATRYPAMTTADLRYTFLIEALHQPGTIQLTYLDLDRAILGMASPLAEPLPLPTDDLLRATYFLELAGLRLEAGPEGRSPIPLRPEFLESFLELRETFSEGVATPEVREQMRERIIGERTDRADALMRELTAAPDGSTREALLPLAQQVLELRYYDRFLAELEEDEEIDR